MTTEEWFKSCHPSFDELRADPSDHGFGEFATASSICDDIEDHYRTRAFALTGAEHEKEREYLMRVADYFEGESKLLLGAARPSSDPIQETGNQCIWERHIGYTLFHLWTLFPQDHVDPAFVKAQLAKYNGPKPPSP